MRVGSLLQFVGGAVGRVAATGIIIGVFFVVMGMLPWQFVVGMIQQPPDFMRGPWVGPSLTLVGLALISVMLWFNLWSQKQQAIDDLSEELRAAYELRRRRPVNPDDWPKMETYFSEEFEAWHRRVNEKLANRAFFTKADQNHFLYIGPIMAVSISGVPSEAVTSIIQRMDQHAERLREIMQLAQMRRR
jgi:hypothetical protein